MKPKVRIAVEGRVFKTGQKLEEQFYPAVVARFRSIQAQDLQLFQNFVKNRQVRASETRNSESSAQFQQRASSAMNNMNVS